MKKGFFDPLYKVVILQDPMVFRPRSALSSAKQDLYIKKAVTPLIETIEFTRLARLKQSELLYLLFPSATHTRFAHSLGCCHLGSAACAAVEILDADEQGSDPVILGEWLDRREWRDEFLIALLLHDLGHPAFSHLIELNKTVENLFGMPLNHEKVTCELILGEGLAYDAIATSVEKGTKALRTSEVLNQLANINSDNKTDNKLICYFISGNMDFISDKSPRMQRQAKIVHALTSGLLDLDRVDHYRRDSEFMGLDIGFNYQALLHGLSVEGLRDGSSNIKIRLQPDAVGHAITLLHLRERLNVDCFMTPRALALDAMTNWMIGRFLNKKHSDGESTTDLMKYLYLCDDELLGLMCQCQDEKVRTMANMVISGPTFELIGHWALKMSHNLSDVEEMVTTLNKTLNGKSMVLYKAHPALVKGPNHDKEWMDIECLLDHKGNRLGASGPYKNQISHFKRTSDLTHREIWFFCDTVDTATIERLKHEIRDSIFEQEIQV